MSFKSDKCIGKKSGKPLTCYETEEEAFDAIKDMEDRFKDSVPMCSYKCTKCGYYHLSPKNRHTESKLCSCEDSNGKKKQLYNTKESAQRRANILKKEKNVELFVYPCPHGNGYHLTHKNPNFY